MGEVKKERAVQTLRLARRREREVASTLHDVYALPAMRAMEVVFRYFRCLSGSNLQLKKGIQTPMSRGRST